MKPFQILIVDDDPVQLEIIATAARALTFPPIDIHQASNLAGALEAVDATTFDLIICDIMLPDGRGDDVLLRVRERSPVTRVILITAHESVDDAVRLMKLGATDYVTKPIAPGAIQQMIGVSLEWRQTEIELYGDDDDPAGAAEGASGIMETVSDSMRDALRDAMRAAASTASILIYGESGTGKELLARAIHDRSDRNDRPYVPIHMAALPESLMESELFGHAKGAFTGATGERAGVFEQADGGTLFLDELGEIPLTVQVKLLRAIQFRQIQRVGDSQLRELDVRIIAATNRDLDEMVREGTFREDLFYRINVVSVRIPPLRERRADIPRLVERMIEALAERNHRNIAGITQRALNRLLTYDFPGNVRELENLLERAIVLARRTHISEDDLPPYVLSASEGSPVPGSLDDQLHALERRLILEALQTTGGHQSNAASLLEITERRLRSRMERLGIANPY